MSYTQTKLLQGNTFCDMPSSLNFYTNFVKKVLTRVYLVAIYQDTAKSLKHHKAFSMGLKIVLYFLKDNKGKTAIIHCFETIKISYVKMMLEKGAKLDTDTLYKDEG